MNELKLKPCPFCGGEGKLVNFVSNSVPYMPYAHVECKKCKNATANTFDMKSDFTYMFNAIKAWNRRTDNEEDNERSDL